jgi:hypothetical protein
MEHTFASQMRLTQIRWEKRKNSSEKGVLKEKEQTLTIIMVNNGQ